MEVGGQAQYYSDFDKAVMASYPLTVGLVLCMSALALLLVFRAPLVSAKAIVLNLFSVAAGYGIVVLVFQLGHGSELFGVEAADGSRPDHGPTADLLLSLRAEHGLRNLPAQPGADHLR